MQSKEWNFEDKSDWPDGPWKSEPDKAQWTDAETGLPCLMVRGPSGALCGYVGVDKTHPLYGKKYSDTDLSAHGGLTFASPCAGEPDSHSICHLSEPGEPDEVYWFGFDCAHAYDRTPKFERDLKSLGMAGTHHSFDVYRDLAYIKAECADLAKQLAELA